MSASVKKKIQGLLVQRRHRLYEGQIARQALDYDVWMENLLREEAAEISGWNQGMGEAGERRLSVGVLSREDFCGYVLRRGASDAELPGAESSGGSGAETESFVEPGSGAEPSGGTGADRELPDIWLVAAAPSRLVPGAGWEVERFFLEHPSCEIAYGDEDGYFKPDWSPDLLQSFFYFGNVFAVRRSLVEKISIGKAVALAETETELLLRKRLYEIVLCCMDVAETAGHIEKILFRQGGSPRPTGTMIPAGDSGTDWGMEPEYAELKKGHLYSDAEIPAGKEEQELVSVVIPSRDNPEVLATCIHSLLKKTSYRNLELIVVDNGSSEENRQKVLKLQQQIQQGEGMPPFRYLYRPMTFNFSAMCNLGAGEAAGKYLLFLNDDIEVVRPNWLSAMVSRGAKGYVGAVGAKLLYPGSDMIQHVGVTNIHLGPAHKLQFSSDREIYYHGFNRCAVNVSAVTGACLLIRKNVFEEIGGFEEELQVAFNDVELCFHLLRAGYRNICCNQTWLYHHESLSRGSDDGEQKVARLHRERDFLYAAYPEMWNRDAYYSRRLVTDVLDRGFHPACRFEEKRMSAKAVPVPMKGSLRPVWHNETLFMGLEFTGDETAWRTGTPGGGDYYIQGWSYALHVDNSRYQKSLLLKMGNRLWKIPYEGCYRPDFQEGMGHIDHPALCGVSVWIPRHALPAGEYLIGYFWEDTCSRQKLYGFSAEKLIIREGA